MQWKEGALRTWLQLGIPAFFYISGISSSFAYSRTDKVYPELEPGKVLAEFGKFTYKKLMRLVFPLLLVIPVFLLPRLYWGQLWEDTCYIDG